MILKFALREFLDDCKYTNLSDHRIKNYKRILNSFVEYCVGQENITSVKDVSRGTILMIWKKKTFITLIPICFQH